MPRFLPRLLMLLVLAFYASGVARWSHLHVAHGGGGAAAVEGHTCHHGGAGHHGHSHSDAGNDEGQNEGSDPSEPAHDDCPECFLLGAMKPAMTGGASGVAIAPRPPVWIESTTRQAPATARLRTHEARGPPRA